MSEGLYRTSKERREDPTLEFLYRSAGPVWYRGMVCTDEKYDPLTPEQTDALLRRYDADRLPDTRFFPTFRPSTTAA